MEKRGKVETFFLLFHSLHGMIQMTQSVKVCSDEVKVTIFNCQSAADASAVLLTDIFILTYKVAQSKVTKRKNVYDFSRRKVIKPLFKMIIMLHIHSLKKLFWSSLTPSFLVNISLWLFYLLSTAKQLHRLP